MKLNPPASSSDLDAARAIARRLHRRARGHERATDQVPDVPAVALDEVAAPVSPVDPAPPEPAPFEAVAPEPIPVQPAVTESSPVEPTGPEPAAFEPEPEPAPVEPAGPEPTPIEPAVPESPLAEPAPLGAPADEASPFKHAGDGEALAGLSEVSDGVADAPDAQTIETPPPELSSEREEPEAAASSSDPWASEATPAEGSAALPAALEDVTAPSEIDPDNAFGDLAAAEAAPALEALETPTGMGSPEDLLGDAPGPEWREDNPLEAQMETESPPAQAPDDLASPATPPWDDVADKCLVLAQVHAAMLVDPSGQILSARGSWPEPGPEAIGGRLVSMMEKTLQDAPTRSVSAPLAGQHLTAWRVPSSEGYYTVVFMGDAPLGADVRSPVDVEIKQALDQ